MENKNIISWKAQEFKIHDKTNLWYICFGAAALLLIAYAIYIRNILTLITFALLSTIAFFLSQQNPKELNHELRGTGIVVGMNMYPYRNIKKFWIIYTPDNKTLNFETTAYLNNQISIQLGGQDPLLVKQFLKSYLPEDLEKEESLTDIITRKIKF